MWCNRLKHFFLFFVELLLSSFALFLGSAEEFQWARSGFWAVFSWNLRQSSAVSQGRFEGTFASGGSVERSHCVAQRDYQQYWGTF
jgi:hypothetical protein